MLPDARQGDLWAERLTGETRARDIQRLLPLARELAARAGEAGVTIADVRVVAVQRGLLTGEESGRRLSYLGAVMRAAGLQATDRVRRSPIPKSHNNRHTVWILCKVAA